LENTFDLIVIGGGPGGYVSAIRASELGMKVALIEKENVGGTCLNKGCIPTKALLHTGEVLSSIKDSEDLGITVENVKYDIKKVYAKKDKVVKQLRGGIEYLLKNNSVTLYRGDGSLVDKNTALIKGKETSVIKGNNIIIATGSIPSVPPIPGADGKGIWTSDDVLSLEGTMPKEIIIIGGGVIGVEFATVFNDFDCKVTIVEMMEHILPGIDTEVSDILRKNLEKKGIAIYTGAKVKGIEGETKKVISFEYKGEVIKAEGDAVLISAGRRPYTQGLNLDKLGVKQNRGFVEVDKNKKTNIDNIYAIGDVIGGIQLAHVASAEGICAVESIHGEKSRINFNIVPSCIYTRPEIACVGLTEGQAKDKGYEVKAGKFPMSANGKSLIMGDTEGFVKIVTDQKTGEILGACIMGPRATDMIGEIAAAMNGESTIEELALTIHPHPTVCETIMEASHDVEGLCVHIPKKAKK